MPIGDITLAVVDTHFRQGARPRYTRAAVFTDSDVTPTLCFTVYVQPKEDLKYDPYVAGVLLVPLSVAGNDMYFNTDGRFHKHTGGNWKRLGSPQDLQPPSFGYRWYSGHSPTRVTREITKEMQRGNRDWVVYVGVYPRPQALLEDDDGKSLEVTLDEFEAEMLVVQNVHFREIFIADSFHKRRYREIKSMDDRILNKEAKLLTMRLAAQQALTEAWKGVPALDLDSENEDEPSGSGVGEDEPSGSGVGEDEPSGSGVGEDEPSGSGVGEDEHK